MHHLHVPFAGGQSTCRSPREAIERNDRLLYFLSMQTTLRLDEAVYREAKAEAARRGVTLTRFIEDALRQLIAARPTADPRQAEIDERNRLMDALLRRTAHFRVGRRPTRAEMSER